MEKNRKGVEKYRFVYFSTFLYVGRKDFEAFYVYEFTYLFLYLTDICMLKKII